MSPEINAIEKLEKSIKNAKDTLYVDSMSDDFYYSNGGYDRQIEYIKQLEHELEILKTNK